MMRYSTPLVIALMVASLAIEDADAGYKAINNYLIAKVPDEEVGSNMKAAYGWLRDLEKAKFSILSRNTIKDLKKFTSLQQVIDDTRCDRKAFEIMRDNQWTAAFNLVKRVNRVIDKILREHAIKCSGVYPPVFRTKKEEFGPDAFERVRVIGASLMEADKTKAEKQDGGEKKPFDDLDNIRDLYAFERYKITDPGNGQALLKALKVNAKGKINSIYMTDVNLGKKVVYKSGLIELVGRHLVLPCEEYVDMFGADIFMPARLEAYYYLPKPEQANSDFYYGWAYFTICKSLIENESAVINDMINSANSQTA